MAASRPPVVLTRSPADSEGLAAILRGEGFPVVIWPMIGESEAVVPPGGMASVQAALRRCQWAVFTSRRAVTALESLLPAGELPRRLESVSVAAVGDATAKELAARGVAADLVGDGQGTGTFAPLLARHLPPRTRVLLLRSRAADMGLPSALAAAGLVVESSEIYEPADAGTAAPLAPQPLAAVACASPSAARRLVLGHPWTRESPFVAIGPTTEKALREELGVATVFVAEEPTAEAMAAAIRRAAAAANALPPAFTETERRRSAELYVRACKASPGGVHSPVRAFHAVGGFPVFFDRAEGAHAWDADGRRYLDLCMSWGALPLGHAHPAVVEAVAKAASRGLSFGACHAAEVELAETILAAFPGDVPRRVRFTSSGTEAVMTAVRLARARTDRTLVVKLEGGYHGHSDGLLVSAGSGLATFGVATSEGVPRAIAGRTLVAPLGDVDALAKLFAEHGDDIACVLIEPVPANAGLLVQEPEFLQAIDDLCERHGALVVADEVITGFRLRPGPLRPRTLTTLGKIVGGGMPLAAVVGEAAVMDELAPTGRVYQAGTLSGNPVSVAAGLATLRELADGKAHARLEELGARFALRVEAAGPERLRVQRVGSMLWPYFAAGALPRRASDVAAEAVRRYVAAYPALLERGLYLPPSAHEVLFLSTAHSEADVDEAADALAEEASRVANP